MLVDDYLVAVVSLPAGVFNPYSGVKTSILILDKPLAKKTSTIAFFKVENDGYGLGAQRRAIDKNDLPSVAAALQAFRHSREGGNPEEFDPNHYHNALLVDKTRIAANGDYNLSAERYREDYITHTQWPLVSLSDICEFRSGLWKGKKEPLRVVKILRNTNFTKTGFLNMDDVAELPVEANQLESRLLQYGDIILEKSGGGPTQPVGRVALFNISTGEYSFSNFTTRIRVVDERVDPFFVWLMLNHFYQIGRTEPLQKQTSGIRNLDNVAYQALQIPLPPLEVQKEIVAEIEGYQKVIDGARAVLDNYHPHIPIDPDWPMVKLSEVARARNGFAFKSEEYVGAGLRVMRIKNVQKGRVIDDDPKFIAPERAREFAGYSLKAGDILMSLTGNVGRVGRLEPEYEPAVLNQRVAHIEIKAEGKILPAYLFAILDSDRFEDAAIKGASGVAQANLSSKWVENHEIPLPPLATQQAIVAEIEAEQKLVAANRELIARFEKKIQATLARVWGEEVRQGGTR
jgi:type I restriction enzyme M protein